MVLYSASLMDFAAPVTKPNKKNKPVKVALETPTVLEHEEIAVVKTLPEKKPRTEKQIAALEKMKAARLEKKLALEKEKLKISNDAENLIVLEKQKTDLKEKKKVEAAERRKLKRSIKHLDVAVDEAVNENIETVERPIVVANPTFLKKKRVAKKLDDTPPEWFQQYIDGVKSDINLSASEPKPLEVLKTESSSEAKKHWNNSFTRAKVNNEIENHMDKMYQMMFGRKMK